MQIAKFDARYLDVRALLSNWRLSIGPTVEQTVGPSALPDRRDY